jgi:hypothetical protein
VLNGDIFSSSGSADAGGAASESLGARVGVVKALGFTALFMGGGID